MLTLVRREPGRSVARRNGDTWSRPFGALEALLRWDPLEGGSWFEGEAFAFSPRFEVKEAKGDFVVKADLPGVGKDDVNVTLENGVLTVSGIRRHEKNEKEEHYRLLERSYGSFSRSLTLGEGVDAANISATMKDGVLTLTLPKLPEAQPKQIEVH